METLSSWKKLVIQAFKETPIATNRRSCCNVFNIQQFVYRALENAGIENRSPFTLGQLVRIRYQSKGEPQSVRDLCIQTLQQMQKPAMGFNSSYGFSELVAVLMTLLLLVAPQTATTFRAPLNGESILKILVAPIEEIDAIEINLPSTTDYLAIAGPVKITPPEMLHPSGLADKKWILQQKDSAYSLQILSASNNHSLESFCKKHHICDQSAYYQAEVKGKPIIRLLYGVYPNHQAAKMAKKHLPKSLNKISPWARQFKQIKKEL